MTSGKTIALTRQTSVSKAISLLFNTLSRFVIAGSSQGAVSFNFMAVVTIHSDLGAQENKTFHVSSLSPICHEVM